MGRLDCIFILSVIYTFFLWHNRGIIDIIQGYCQYQRTDHETVNYLSVWCQTHYDVTDKNNNVSIEGFTYIITSITACVIELTVIVVVMSVSTLITSVILCVYNSLCYWTDW
jgi:hypothetical protein